MSETSSHGRYRLKRQKNGVGNFGQVAVEAITSDGSHPPEVVWAVRPDDRYSVQPGVEQEFVDAAQDGVREGLRLAAAEGIDTGGLTVSIIEAELNMADIATSAVRAAGVLAVLDALGIADRFELGYADGWTVVRR